MLDNPEKTARLLAALKAQVLFEVELVSSLVNYLRAQGWTSFVADTKRQRQTRRLCRTKPALNPAKDKGIMVNHCAPLA